MVVDSSIFWIALNATVSVSCLVTAGVVYVRREAVNHTLLGGGFVFAAGVELSVANDLLAGALFHETISVALLAAAVGVVVEGKWNLIGRLLRRYR